MARKRKSSELEPKASATIMAVRNSEALTRDLDILCQKADINLSYKARESPATLDKYNIKRRVCKNYEFLWWRNRPALAAAEEDYLQTLTDAPLGTYYSQGRRIELLLEKLKAPAAATPKKAAKYLDKINEPEPDPTQVLPPSPGSPLLSRSNSTAARPHDAKKKTVTGVSRLSFPKAMHPATDLRSAFMTAKADASKPAAAANISFKSTTTATTSFNRSFQSSQGFPATQDTAATSFSEDVPPPKRESDYFSSLSTVGMEKLNALAEQTWPPTQKSHLMDETIRPNLTSDATWLSAPRDSQSTCYGESLAPTDWDDAFARLPPTSQDVEMTDGDIQEVPSYVPTGCQSHEVPKQVKANPLQTGSLSKTVQSPRSPCKPHTRIGRDFARLNLPETFSSVHFVLQWEVQRVLQTNIFSAEELGDKWKTRTLSGLYELLSEHRVRFTPGFDPDSSQDFEDVTLSAKLQWTESNNAPLFNLVLNGPKKETSCALQRRLGADRVLYVDLPVLEHPPTAHSGRHALDRFQRFCRTPQTFLGRRWICYFLQPKKGEREFHRLILIAESSHTSFIEALLWALPIFGNTHQMACKAYMRKELQLSRTIVALKLFPKDIAYDIADLTATSDADDRRFEDPMLGDQFYEKFDPKIVMNDGCNLMSIYIAAEYARIMKLDTIPSTLQMRVAGSKGIWSIIDEDPRSIHQRPEGPLIWISKSQIKVHKDPALDCDEHWLSANVVRPNMVPRESFLYNTFLPILEDRGVPRDVLYNVVRSQVNRDAEEFLTALAQGPLPLRQWMQAHMESGESKNRDAGIGTIGGFPITREEKMIRMIESGFDQRECTYLANEAMEMAKDTFDLKNKHFKPRLSQSLTLTGMADHTNSLPPGEGHVYLDKAFLDTATCKSLVMFDGMECLVARNPALGPSDIQKIRLVFKPQLARYKNMIVFSAKGMRPFAGKLQGGDYDGDTFWITWCEELVRPFKNAPAPWMPLRTPEHYGIVKDDKRLSDYIDNPLSIDQWCRFQSDMAVFRMSSSGTNMLGNVTLHIESLVYKYGTVAHRDVLELIPLHDYLVDADKQGYRYSSKAFHTFLKRAGIDEHPPVPKYWEITKAGKDVDKEKQHNSYKRRSSEEVHGNIIDDMFSTVVTPIFNETILRARNIVKPAGAYDPDLYRFYDQTMASVVEGSDIHKELKALENEKFRKLRDIWTGPRLGTRTEFRRQMRNEYDQMLPQNTENPAIKELLRRQGHAPSPWDLLKASCLAKFQHYGTKKGAMMFSVAGRELCILKANELDPEVHHMLQSHYHAMKLRKMKKPRPTDEYDSDNVENEANDDDVNDRDDRNNDEIGYY
ncbi:RNA-directed RNA polymerase [Lecanosticta acicola]|uniref:RNA-dependent RNA polymerase n=1 Tax=Lecanosticta acicola TaxID=111012 RepID=A0AAI9E6Y0_9PEZI|nr:RNA-directed RNA polymerase [Lecanosticta acicola]